MVREPIYAAMDIGTSKVVAIVARLGPEGELRLMGTGEAPAQGVEHGVIEDAEAAREAVRESLGECLRYMGRNPVHDCYAVVNGDHLVGSNAREMLGGGDGMLTVTEQHLRSLVSGTSGAVRELLDSRNEQVLHIIPVRYRLDGMAGGAESDRAECERVAAGGSCGAGEVGASGAGGAGAARVQGARGGDGVASAGVGGRGADGGRAGDGYGAGGHRGWHHQGGGVSGRDAVLFVGAADGGESADAGFGGGAAGAVSDGGGAEAGVRARAA